MKPYEHKQKEQNIMSDDQMTKEEWLAIRKEAALHIDPVTAEFRWEYAETGDPYGVYPELAGDQVGREYFVRSPGSDVWVWFGDLPDATADALRKRIEERRARNEVNWRPR